MQEAEMNQTETESLQTMQFEGIIQDIEYPNPDKPEENKQGYSG